MYSPLNAVNSLSVTHGSMFSSSHEKINLLLFVLSISFFLFYGFNLNLQGLVCLKFVKYQMGRHGNVRVFAKFNVCIAAIHLFYIQTCQAFFLYQSKLYIFPMLGLANILFWNPYLYIMLLVHSNLKPTVQFVFYLSIQYNETLRKDIIISQRPKEANRAHRPSYLDQKECTAVQNELNFDKIGACCTIQFSFLTCNRTQLKNAH